MDSVLYKIIEIERAAQNISDEAARAKRNLPGEIEEERKKIKLKIKDDTDAQINRFTSDESQDEKKRIDELEQQKDRQIAMLRDLFNNNGSKWEDEIYETIRKK